MAVVSSAVKRKKQCVCSVNQQAAVEQNLLYNNCIRLITNYLTLDNRGYLFYCIPFVLHIANLINFHINN